jgi:hypothetical protein
MAVDMARMSFCRQHIHLPQRNIPNFNVRTHSVLASEGVAVRDMKIAKNSDQRLRFIKFLSKNWTQNGPGA